MICYCTYFLKRKKFLIISVGTKSLKKILFSKIIEQYTPAYELIDIFHDIGKNSDVKRQIKEHILASGQLRHFGEASCSKVFLIASLDSSL